MTWMIAQQLLSLRKKAKQLKDLSLHIVIKRSRLLTRDRREAAHLATEKMCSLLQPMNPQIWVKKIIFLTKRRKEARLKLTLTVKFKVLMTLRLLTMMSKTLKSRNSNPELSKAQLLEIFREHQAEIPPPMMDTDKPPLSCHLLSNRRFTPLVLISTQEQLQDQIHQATESVKESTVTRLSNLSNLRSLTPLKS